VVRLVNFVTANNFTVNDRVSVITKWRSTRNGAQNY
jgi:hypothetical protein